MRRRVWWWSAAAALVGLPVAAIGAAAWLFDPNDYKDRIVDAVQSATGRTLTLRGPLRISRSLWPTLEVNDVELANLEGGTRADIARAERIEGQISLFALLQHRIEVTKLTLIGPNILFEQVNGQPNWVFQDTAPETAPVTAPGAAPVATPAPARSGFQLRIRRVHVQNGMVTWRLPARTKVVGIRTLDFDHLVDRGPVDVRSTLVYSDNQPFSLNATAQPTGSVMQPWSTQLQFAAFDTIANANGTADVAGHYDLQVDAESGALEKLNALLPEMRLPMVRGATLSTRIGNGKQPGDLPVVGQTRLRFAQADLRDRVPGLTLGAVEASLPAAGAQAHVVGDGHYAGAAFSLQGDVGVPTHPDGLVRLPVSLKADVSGAKTAAGSLSLKGTLALQTLQFAGLETAASLQTPALAGLRPVLGQTLPALTDVRFDGQLSIPAGGGAVGVKGVKLVTAQGEIEGSGTVALDGPVTLAGKWRSDVLDLDAMLAAFGIDLSIPASARSGGPAIPATPLPWGVLRGPNLDLSGTVAVLRFQDRVWRDMQFGLLLKDGRLRVSPLKLAGPAGALEGALDIDAAARAAPVSLTLRAPALPLALVGRYAGLPGPFAGDARVDLRLHGSGQTVRELAASLDGPFSIATVGGRMSNAALIELTAGALAPLGITVPPQGETVLTCLGVAGAFAKGVGTLRTIALETTYLSLQGIGQVDLGRETVAFKLRPMAQVSGSPVSVPVVIEGKFDAIKGRLDASGLEQLGLFVDGLFGGDTSTACADAGLVPPRP